MNALDIYFTFTSSVKQPTTSDVASQLIYNTIGEFFGKTTGNYIEDSINKLITSSDLLNYVLEKGQSKTIVFDRGEIINIDLKRNDDDYFNNPPVHSWEIKYVLYSKVYKCVAIHPDRTYTCYLPGNNEIVDIKLLNTSNKVFVK